MNLQELIAAIDTLIRDGEAFSAHVSEGPPLPERLGNCHEPEEIATMRLMSGQTLGVSPRVLKEVSRRLTGYAATDSRLHDAIFVPDNQGGHIECAGKIWRPVQ